MADRAEEIQQLYLAGMSCRQIATKLQVSCHKKISEILRKRGIVLRSAADAQKLRHPSKVFPPRQKVVYLCSGCHGIVSNKNNSLCRECWRQRNRGASHPSYKGGKPSCKGCGAALSSYSLKKNLCRQCHDKIRGAAHWAWKGGTKGRKLNTLEYRTWRNSVFERDRYICRKCSRRGGKLHAHHIIYWSESVESRFDLDNGLTLCVSCHRAEHDKNGWKPRGLTRNELLSAKGILWGN